MFLRLSLLVVVVCAMVSAGCSGPDAPKKKDGPVTRAPAMVNELPA